MEDYEFCDFIDAYEDEDEEYYNKLMASSLIRKSASNTSGTPLNLELAQLMQIDEDSSSFGISKNVETLEKSTIVLEKSTLKPRSSTPNSLTDFLKSSELFLRIESDKESPSDRTPCCSCKSSPATNEPSNEIPQTYQGTNELIYEHPSFTTNNLTNFIEPNSSFHSVNGYDNEQVMFEGTTLLYIITNYFIRLYTSHS